MQAQDSLAAGNLVAVIAHLYGCKVIDAATVYSLLEYLQHRWTFPARDALYIEHIITVTNCCSPVGVAFIAMTGPQLASG